MREYLRARSLARVLHARVYMTPDGQMHRTSGLPDFECLFRALLNRKVAAIDVRQVGFRVASEGAFSKVSLQLCSRALTRWESHLTNAARRNRRRRALKKERAEIERLRLRLATLYRWLGCAPEDRNTIGSEFLLDDQQERELQSIIERSALNNLSPSACRLTRLVYWVRGPAATVRYLDEMAAVSNNATPITPTAEVLLSAIADWEHRVNLESSKKLEEEMKAVIAALPDGLRARAQLSTKLKGKTFREHCAMLRSRCRDWVEAEGRRARANVGKALAALTCCGPDDVPLPRRVAVEYLNDHFTHGFRYSIAILGSQLGEPAYRRLVTAINKLPVSLDAASYSAIRQLLLQGTKLKEIEWLHAHRLLAYFDNAPYTPRWTRHVQRTLEDVGVAITLSEILDHLKCVRDVQLTDEFVGWYRSLLKSGLTPRLSTTVEKALVGVWLPALSRLRCHDELERWVRPPTELPNCGKMPNLESQACMNRIAHYQNMAGVTPAVPKSLRKQLHFRERYEREVAHLTEIREQTGKLSPEQQSRLHNLQDRLQAAKLICPKRVLRTAQEAYITTALDALRHVVRRAASRLCLELAGLEDVPVQWLFDLAAWIDGMNKWERAIVGEIVSAWTRHRRLYRVHLARNEPWLKKAREQGLSIDDWLAPPGTCCSIDGKRFRIEVSHHPVETFLMGSYVNTCLSLPDGCNAYSVRANAYDANKQVLYLSNAAGDVVARQLVAISGDFQLVGYTIYATFPDEDESLWDGAKRELATYCGRWAQRVGVTLADTGQPETILDEEWYDDDACSWDEAAQRAWNDGVVAASKSWRATAISPDEPGLVLAGAPLA
jgi:hypothetical protein